MKKKLREKRSTPGIIRAPIKEMLFTSPFFSLVFSLFAVSSKMFEFSSITIPFSYGNSTRTNKLIMPTTTTSAPTMIIPLPHNRSDISTPDVFVAALYI